MKMDWIPYIPLENRYYLVLVVLNSFQETLLFGSCKVLCQFLDIIVHFQLSTETAKLIDLNLKYSFWAALKEGWITLILIPLSSFSFYFLYSCMFLGFVISVTELLYSEFGYIILELLKLLYYFSWFGLTQSKPWLCF